MIDHNPCADINICSGCGGTVFGVGPNRREPETGVVWCGVESCAGKAMYIHAWLYVAETYKKVKLVVVPSE